MKCNAALCLECFAPFHKSYMMKKKFNFQNCHLDFQLFDIYLERLSLSILYAIVIITFIIQLLIIIKYNTV
jgi:hypothetical protein